MEIVNRTVLLFYFASELIERKLKSLSIIETVLVALEFLEIAFILIRRTLRTCQLINPDYLNAQATFDMIYQLAGPSEYFCLAVAGITCLYLTLLLLIKIQWIGANQREAVCWCCSIMFLFIRISLLPLTLQTYFAVTLGSSAYPLLGIARYPVIAVMLISGFYCLILISRKLTLEWLHVAVPVIWFSVQNDTLLLSLVISFCLYNVFTKKDEINPLLFPLAIISAWSILEMQTPNSYLSEMILLITPMFAVGVFMAFFRQLVNLPEKKEKQIESYWTLAQQKKEAKLSMSDEFKIEQIMMEQYANGEEKALERLKDISKDVPNWQRKDHLILLSSQIEVYQSSNTKNEQFAELLGYRFKLEEERDNLKTLLVLHDRYEKLGNSKLFFRYSIYKLIIELQLWFGKSKNESAYLQNAVLVDVMASKYYQKLFQALTHLKEVWTILQRTEVDPELVEARYCSLMLCKQQLELLYKQISRRCSAESELQKLKALLKVLSITLHESIASPARLFQDGQKPVQQVPYLVVKDRKIVEVPFRFINEFGYSVDELLSSPIEMIVPAVFQKSFLKLDCQATGVKFQSGHQLIIDGQGFIHLVNSQAYIVPNFADGIRYMLFFQHQPSQAKQLFFVYNTAMDIVEDASRQLIEQFQVDSTIFQGEPIYGKDVFESFDWNSQQNRKALESAEGALITINLKHLTSSVAKMKVFMKIITKFEGLDKPRMLLSIERSRTVGRQAMLLSERNRNQAAVSRNTLQNGTFVDEKSQQQNDKLAKTPPECTDRYLLDIAQKKDSLKRSQSRRSLMSLTIIMYILIAVLVIGFVGIYVSANLRLQWMSFMGKEIEDINQRNLLLSEMMMQCLTLYHLKVYPPSQLNATQNALYQQQASATLQTTTITFQQLYVKNLQNQRFKSLPFLMKFSNYNLSLSTGDILLIDYVWESTLMLSSNVLPFVIENYGIVKVLRQQIAQLDQYIASYLPYSIVSQIVMYVVVVLTIALYGLFICLMYPVQKTLMEVEQLYSFLPASIAQKQVVVIESLIGQISSIARTEQSSKFLQSMRDEPVSNQTSVDDEHRPPMIARQQRNFFLQAALQMVVLVAIMTGYLANVQTYLVSQSKLCPDIVTSEHQLRLQQLDLKNSLIDSYYRVLLRKYNGSDFPTSYNSTLTTLLAEVNNRVTEATQFNDFSKNWWFYLNQDVCLFSSDADQISRCHQLYLGILQQGYSKSIKEYQRGLKRLQAKQLDDLYGSTLLQDSLLAQKFLLLQNSNINKKYTEGELQYRQDLQITHFVKLLVGIAMTLLLVLALYWNRKRQVQKIQICKLLFINAPDEMLSLQQCRKVIEQGELLVQLLKL